MRSLLLALNFAVAVQGSEHFAISNSDVLHFPQSTPKQALNEYDVSNFLSRLMHTASPSDHQTVGLPVVDMFRGPKAVLMLSIEGAADSEVESKLHSLNAFNKKSKVYDIDSESAAPGLSALKMLSGGHRVNRITDALRAGAIKICASADTHIEHACGPETTNFVWNSKERTFIGNGITAALLYNSSQFWVNLSELGSLDFDKNVFVANIDGIRINMDLNDEATNRLFSELSLFSLLPSLVGKSGVFNDDITDFILLSLTGLKNLGQQHGKSSSLYKAGLKIVDAAIPTILEQWTTIVGEGLQKIIYSKNSGDKLTEKYSVHTNRKLLSLGQKLQAGASPVTLSDIAEYQIVLWMAVLLIVVVFASSISLGVMKFGEDDAGLYSQFKSSDYGVMAHGHVE